MSRLQGFNAQRKREQKQAKEKAEIDAHNQREIQAIRDLQNQADQLDSQSRNSRVGYSDHRSSIESKRSRNSRSSPINFLENTSKINLATKPAAGGGGGGALGGMLAAGILGGVTKKFEEDMGKHGDQSAGGNLPKSADSNKQKLEAERKISDARQGISGKTVAMTKSLAQQIQGIQLNPGEFRVRNFLIKRVPNSLFCCRNTNPVRKMAAKISEDHLFDTVIIFFIFLNCLAMASRDYMDKDDKTQQNQTLNTLDYIFSFIFFIEATLKIITNGFIFGKKTYLRNPWNVLDFIIVLAALIDIYVTFSGADSSSLSALKTIRILRVLRPLKAVKTLPSLRKQVSALLKSLKKLVNVMVFLFAMFILGGVMGLQLFMESAHFGCRMTEKPLPGATEWPRYPGTGICDVDGNNAWDSSRGYKCPEGSFCGNPLDYGLSPDKDIELRADYQFGFGIFKDIFDSIFAIFQIITMDGWTVILYNLAFHEAFWIPSIFCTILVFMGSFFMLNLMLAVIMDSYESASNEEGDFYKAQQDQEMKELEERIAKHESMSEYSELNDLLKKKQERVMGQFKANFRDHFIKMRDNRAQEQEQKVEKQATLAQNVPDSAFGSVENQDDEFKELDQEILSDQQQQNFQPQQPKASDGGDAPAPQKPGLGMMGSLGAGLLGKFGGGGGGAEAKKPPSTEQKPQSQKIEKQVTFKEGSEGRKSTLKTPQDGLGGQLFEGNHKARDVSSSIDSIALQDLDDETKLLQMEQKNHMTMMGRRTLRNGNDDVRRNKTTGNQPPRIMGRMMQSLGSALLTKVKNSQKELDSLDLRAKTLKDEEAKSVISGIHSRAVAAVNLSRLEDKYLASNQIRLEGNMLINRLGEALKERYFSQKNHYGLKDEGNTMQVLRTNITSQLGRYHRTMTRKAEHVVHNESNPLAAVFAAAQRKKEEEARKAQEEDENDGTMNLKVMKSLKRGKLQPQDQIQIVMDIQNKSLNQFGQQEQILAKMASHLKNLILEKNEMQNIIDATEEVLENDICELRAQHNFIYRQCLLITNSRFFTVFISMCIILNTIVLSFDQYPTDIELLLFIEWANLVFFITFVFEMVIKLFGLGFKIYFKDLANVFDFIVIVFSLADLVLLYLSASLSSGGMKAIQALRVFRLLRVFKLAKIWPEFAYILVTVGNTLRKISAFSVLLLIFIFSFAILGMELFAATLSFDENGTPILNDYDNGLENMRGLRPDSTFNTFLDATLSVFIILANDGWSTIYFDHARVSRYNGDSIALPTIYFISLIIIGQNILFQLFLAILLSEFDERSLIAEANKKREEEEQQDKRTVLDKIKGLFRKIGCKSECCRDRQQDDDGDKKIAVTHDDDKNDKDGKPQIASLIDKSSLENSASDLINHRQVVERLPSAEQQEAIDDQQGGGRISLPSDRVKSDKDEGEVPEGGTANNGTRSLFLFSEDNKFRLLMQRTENANWFKNGILILIIFTSITLAIENPLLDPESDISKALFIIDIVTTVIFTLEVLIKVIASGLILGKQSFLHDLWNILDFLVVVISIASVSLPQDGLDLGTLKILRMGRLFRPLRVLSRNEGLKISIQALFVSIPAITKLMLIVGLFFVIFAIMGVTLFKGEFQSCSTDKILGLSSDQLSNGLIVTEQDCLNYGGEWTTYYKNFNDLGTALMQTITMSQTVGWAEFMYRAMESRGPHQQPDLTGVDKQYYPSLYYCFYIIFGAFFITNLFVGVVISTYNREKDRLGNNFLLSDDQKRWIETKLLVVRVRPQRKNRRPVNPFRSQMYQIAESRNFDIFIMICISLNAIIMSIKYVGQDPEISIVLKYINYAFTGIFFVEMVIRLFAYGLNYFKDNWNVFDFTIVIGSISLIGISIFLDSARITTVVTAARLLRIGRLLRLFRQMKSLQVLFSTFLLTLPHMINVGGIMFLIVYIYAVIGISLFANIMQNGPMTKFLSFSDFYKSFITLIRVATGENWNEVMNALSRESSLDYPCIENPTYEDLVANGMEPVGCGNRVIAQVYFLTFIFIVGLIFLNLFIAIILQGYYQTQDQEKQIVNSEVLQMYKEAWAKFDPDANGYIDCKQFPELMLSIGAPLGWDESYRDRKEKQDFFFELIKGNMKTYHNHEKINFSDVLDAITLFYIINMEVREEMEANGIEYAIDNEMVDSDYDSEEYGDSSSGTDPNNPDNPSSDDEDSMSDNDGPGGDHAVKSKGESSARSAIKSSARKSSARKLSGRHSLKHLNVGDDDKDDGDRVPHVTVGRLTAQESGILQMPGGLTAAEDGSGDKKLGNNVQRRLSRKQKQNTLVARFQKKKQTYEEAENEGKSMLVKTLQKKKEKIDKKKRNFYRQDSELNQKKMAHLLGTNTMHNIQARSGTSVIGDKSKDKDLDQEDANNQIEASSFQTDYLTGVNSNSSETGGGGRFSSKDQDGHPTLSMINTMAMENNLSVGHQRSYIGNQVDVINEEDEDIDEELNRLGNDEGPQRHKSIKHESNLTKNIPLTLMDRSLTQAPGRQQQDESSLSGAEASQLVDQELDRMQNQDAAQQQRQMEEQKTEQVPGNNNNAASGTIGRNQQQHTSSTGKIQEVQFESD